MHILNLSTDHSQFLNLAKEHNIIFHMSAVHGGREFVNTRQSDTAKNFAIDYHVISAPSEAGIEHIAYASSACVYPPRLQDDPTYLLKEDDILSVGNGWKSSDNVYG